MGINDLLIAFLAFCLGMCVYGMVMLVRAVAAWRERRVRAKAGMAHPKGQSRRRLSAASVLGVLSTLLGGGLAAFITPTFSVDASFAGYRMAVAIALLGLGIACVIVGARWDRAKGRRRCPKCWYSYDGLAADAKCPECGRIAKTERRLLRTRRKPLLYAALPLMIAAAWYAYIAPVAVTWRSYIPTTVMIAGYEWMPETVIVNRGYGDGDTLQDRIAASRLIAMQSDWAASRARNAVMTRERPEDVAAACRILMVLANTGEPMDGLDEAGMRALRMLSDCKPHGGNLPSDDLFHFAVRYAKSNTPIDGEDLDNVMRWTERTKLNLEGRNILLMRLAPRRADVIEAIEEELDLNGQSFSEASDQAALVLGDLIRNDPELCRSIESSFRSSQYTRQLKFSRVLLSTRFKRTDVGATARDVSRVAEHNASLAADIVTSDDANLAEMVTHFPWHALGFEVDDATLISAVSRVAAANPSRRRVAISYLCWRRALGERDVPMLVEYLAENPVAAGIISHGVNLAQLGPAWLPLREPLHSAARSSQQLRGVSRADRLEAMLARLDQIAAEEAGRNAPEPSSTP